MYDIHRILRSAQEGDVQAAQQLTEMLYDELRELARRALASERPNHTLQPTALVNEAYLRLVTGKDSTFADRESFFAAAATAIRRVLVDHSRKRASQKRGGGMLRVPLDGLNLEQPLADEDVLELDSALLRLAQFDPVKARIVELRFFAGLTEQEVVKVMGASESTIRREWRTARAWLRSQLDQSHED